MDAKIIKKINKIYKKVSNAMLEFDSFYNDYLAENTVAKKSKKVKMKNAKKTKKSKKSS